MIYYLYIYNNWFCIVLHPIKIAGITSQTKMWISNPKPPARATGIRITVFICDIALCGTIGATLQWDLLGPIFTYSDTFLLATPRHRCHLIFSQHCSFPQTNPPQFGSLAVSAWTWNRACNYEAFCWTQSSWTGHRLSWYPGMQGACCFFLWKIGRCSKDTNYSVITCYHIAIEHYIIIYIIAWIWIRWGYHATVIKLELCYILFTKPRQAWREWDASPKNFTSIQIVLPTKTSEPTTRPNLLV